MSDLRDRFDRPAAAEMLRFCSSAAQDRELVEEELDVAIAHATMLGERGIIPADDAAALCRALERLRCAARAGEWRPPDDAEDIHMAVEARLIELLGDAGRRLHTARSRNDLVATDARLWLKRRLAELDAALGRLVATLAERIERDGRTLIPGYTHLQRGQPVLLGHHLLAHAWPLVRDRGRVRDARSRLDRSPLGACALAGTSHPIDRERTAALLGFAAVVENAMDAVAARDHEQEAAAACAICLTNLSRMAAELVLWSSEEFGLLRLSAAYTTGSSIMPQKRNPDAAELVRARAAVVAGQLQAVLGVTHGLPLAYNRDLQESRAQLFAAVRSTLESVAITEAMWRTLEVRSERFEGRLDGDLSHATELADLLVSRGLPFREAHAVVARVVRWCEERGVNLTGLTREAAREFHPALDTELAPWLDAQAAVERRTSRGGTAWREVERQLRLLREAGA